MPCFSRTFEHRSPPLSIRVEAIYIAPVKSLGLLPVERAWLTKRGIAEDRRFFLISDRDRLVTQREYGVLTQVQAGYTLEPESLRVSFPDGRSVEAAPEDAGPITARFFGERDVAGTLVEGPWAAALSEFAGVSLRVVRAMGNPFDALPVSLCSSASIEALRSSSGEQAVNERRFRPNFYVSGVAEAHGEDAWVGKEISIGPAARVRVVLRDPRCEMITHDPATGERDIPALLTMITSYRTDQPKETNFGVYGGVVAEGEVAVGDEVASPAESPGNKR